MADVIENTGLSEDTYAGPFTAKLNDGSFIINLGEEGINTYMNPETNRAGVDKTINGEWKVTELAYHNNEEYWKVEKINSSDSSVSTTWVKKNDLESKYPFDSSQLMDKENKAKYDAAQYSDEVYNARMRAVDRDRNLAHLADPTNPDYMTDEELKQAEIDKFGFGGSDALGESTASESSTINGSAAAHLWLDQPGKAEGLSKYAYKIMRVFGMPPQWTAYVDPRVDYSSAIIGRRYSETVLSSPAILSLCPGKLKYSQGLIDVVQGDADMLSALTSGTYEPFWHFEENWRSTIGEGGGYIDCVNIMSRYAACCLSVKDGKIDEGGDIPLYERPCAWGGNRHYMDLDADEFLDPNAARKIFTAEQLSIMETIESLATIAVNAVTYHERHFVHFNLNGQIGMGEEFATETRASVIENLVNGTVDNTVKDVSFMLGGEMGAEVQSDLDTFGEVAKSTLGGTIGALLSAGQEMLKGGSISFPKVIDNCTWGRSINFSVKFSSVYGDVESRFLNVIMPYICLIAFFLPKQLKNKIDMYTYPPVVRAFARGIYACDCGVLTGINVKRGGDDDNAWTASGQPLEIDVTFTIQSLHQNLMQSDNWIWLAKNVGLQLYIGTICGIDMTMPQEDLIKATLRAFQEGIFEDVKRTASYSVYDAIHRNPITQAYINITNF